MTDIEWVQGPDGERGKTWNPVRGCTKVSPGCKHCYAETFAERWRGVGGHPYEQGFDLRLVPEKLSEPLRRRKPTTYFVNSMSDLFHKDVPDEYIAEVCWTMAEAKRHTFQVLTKRADRLRHLMSGPKPHRDWHTAYWHRSMPKNVWWGVSVEDRKHGLPRIDDLRETPAAVRFLSVEPLLEDLGTLNLDGIHWVIVGGESGNGARSMQVDWARSIVEQCRAAGVPVFVKQLGRHPAIPHGSGETVKAKADDEHRECGTWPEGTRFGNPTGRPDLNGRVVILRSKKGKDPDEWPVDLRIREMPAAGGAPRGTT